METINQIGIYLDTYEYKKERYLLYSIDRFFVEVVYDVSQNKIIELNSFKTGYLLDKYSNL